MAGPVVRPKVIREVSRKASPELREALRIMQPGRDRAVVARALGLALIGITLAINGAAAPDRSERLAAACNGCHGTDGRGSGAIPALAGGNKATMLANLRYWRGEAAPAGRDHVMVRFARGLNADDLEPLADYYARLPAAAAEAPE